MLTARLQSDPIERFSQYHRMSGGRFLVSLRDTLNSKRIFEMQIFDQRISEFLGRRLAICREACHHRQPNL